MYSPPNHHQQHRQPGVGLARYVSAPGSFLSNIVDSVMGSGNEDDFTHASQNHHITHQHQQQQQNQNQLHQYFSNGNSSTMSSNESSLADLKPMFQTDSRVYNNNGNATTTATTTTTTTSNGGLQRSYGMNQVAAAAGNSSSLLRHSSSPAGFFNNLMVDNGFSISNGAGGGYTKAGTNTIGHGRLKTQLSFTQDSLSQISEVGESVAGGSSDEGFTVGTWDDAINFSNAANKRAKNNNGDIMNMSDLESQSLFNLPRYQSDSVQCKTRARRGFATHPRSIAERERRGRISENLRKLQELVPNMDKQTSTADMLDLAVQHIKGLQGDVQKLNKDLEGCTCECRKST
ncbi:hypothetical protein C5167_025211 [Papaver somniferum]|uniref:BHLH domain-containing protein n=1 Tax=Papaver somniferum TaxID=3469 RepID=A0A4Y7JQT3_PAPSO|nr:transcription factor bHLH128-like [Papaver somniferum]RZC63453.1 hypothetical protein C5167_025211 [Papaver somniferum]